MLRLTHVFYENISNNKQGYSYTLIEYLIWYIYIELIMLFMLP